MTNSRARAILGQLCRNGDELAARKASAGRIEESLDRIERGFERLESALPAILSQAMRAVWRESGHA